MTFAAISSLVLAGIGLFLVYRAWIHLKQAKQFIAQVKRQNAVRDYGSDWTQQEAIIWRTFLASPTGQILLKRARQMESINAINGSKDVFHTQHSAGSTAGFSDAINWLESLASEETINSLSPAQAQNEQPTADGQHEEAMPVESNSP